MIENATLNSNEKSAAATSRAKAMDWQPTEYDFRDCWFPVAHAPDVGKRPILRAMHACHLYLWRDDGHAVAAEYHPVKRAAMKTRYSEFTAGSGFYPVSERYGYIWVWYGSPEQATEALIPQIPFLPKDGSNIPAYMRKTVRFDGCSALSVENLIDLTHADFLHGEVVGGEGEAESDEVEYSYTSETLTRTRIVVGKPVSPVMRWVGGVRAKYQDFRSTLHVHLRSNVCISYPRFSPGFDVPNVQPFVPSGKYRSRVNQIFSLQAAPTPFRQIMPRLAYVVGPQDNSVIRPQNPSYLELTERRDLHSRFDAPGARYRFLLKKLWQRQQSGDYSYLSDADPGADITALLGMDKA